MPFTHQSRNPGELIRSTDWNTMGDEVERLGGAKVDRAGNDTIAGTLGIRGDLSVGTPNSGATLRVLKRQEDGGDVAHGALVLGNDGDGSASLRLGYSSQFSWLQGLGRQTLAINPRGGDVGIGTDRPRSRLSVAGGLSVGAAWAAAQAAPASSLIVEGSVGIGTAAPAHRLEVQGGADIALFQSSANNAYVRIATSEGLNNRVEVANRPGGRLALWVGSGVDAVNVLRDGRTGIGTPDPQDRLEVRGGLRILTDGNPVRFTSAWSGFPDAVLNQAEISNDVGIHKKLMIVGNKSGGGNLRRVGISDRLDVHGSMGVTGVITPSAGTGEGAGILFPPDVGGGVNDRAWLRYYSRGGEAMTLELGVSNETDDHIALMTSGGVGIGTTTPQDRLEVRGGLRILTDGNPVRFTSAWSGFPDGVLNQSEICNDTVRDKKLMIVGNKSGGGNVRRVGVWDELAVHGKLIVDNDIQLASGKTLAAPGRLHISGDELLYLLNKSGVIISKAWGGNGDLSVEGNTGVSGTLGFGNRTRQMLNLYSTEYGAGVQNSTHYFRTGGHFAWFRGGAHGEGVIDPGGGTTMMVLRSEGNLEVRGNIRLSSDGSLFAAAAHENLRLIRGTVRPDGGKDSGAGFWVQRTDLGVYQINFDTHFAARPAVSVTQIYPDPDNWGVGGNTRDNAILTAIGTGAFRVALGNGDGNRSDRWFSFIVMGPR